MHDCEFDGNAALDGGAVFRGSSSGNVAGSLFRNNTAREFGGAVYDSHVQVGHFFASLYSTSEIEESACCIPLSTCPQE